MNFDQLRYFVETARFQHIGQAAKSVAISPSAISHAISNLEDELGRKLFEKKGKRIFLTHHGKTLFERGELLLAQADAIKADLLAEDRSFQGHYRLASSHLLSSGVLSPAWANLVSENGELSCELFSIRSAQVVAGVAMGEYDLGICFSPQPHPDVDGIQIHSGQLQIAVRSKHFLAGKQVSTAIARLKKLPHVMPKAFQGIDVCEQHPALEKVGLVLRPVFVFDSYDVAAAYVRESDAWGFFPDWVIAQTGLKALVPPKGWSAPYSIHAVVPRARPLPKALKALVEVIRKNRLPG